MGLFPFSRMLRRQSSPESQPPQSSPSPQGDISEQPTSSSNHRRYSKDSEGYPSWLPKRPPPPAPRSTFQSSNINLPLDTSSDVPAGIMVGGRKPTPRSVRIISLHDDYAEKTREPTDQTRVPSGPIHTRAWSRATAPPTVFSDPAIAGAFAGHRTPRPRFRAKGLHLELLESPSMSMRIWFYILRIFVFMHIPVQTFLDFNAAFMLFQVAKFPNPEAPGIPGSGRNWALGAAAYVACWFLWIVGVFLLYEVVYSFARRWRVKRPLIYPLYFSSPAFNLVSVTSFANFSFLYHVRFSSLRNNIVATDSSSDVPNVGSFSGSHPRSISTFLAETFSFYAQNLPTVALLLPRAGLCLALLLAFTSPDPALVALANANLRIGRDSTFFRPNGTLTDYAAGVLWATVAWTAWRTLVLLCSWLGLLILSGQACGGICGPRYRWEEEDAEKRTSAFSAFSSDHPDDISEQYREHDALQWNWRDETRERIIEAWEFCLTIKYPSISGFKHHKETTSQGQLLSPGGEAYPYENMQQVLAAVGLGGIPQPPRRGVLTDDFFRGPGMHSRTHSEQVEIVERTETPPELKSSDVEQIPQVVRKKESKGKGKKPERYPYPFAARSAHMSSEDRIAVPFPPSPRPSDHGHGKSSESASGTPEEDDDDDDGDEDDEEADDDADVEEEGGTGEPRTSGSMSSLGNPVSSRYPFQFRRPARGTTPSASSAAYTHSTSQSQSHSHSNSNSYSVNNRSLHSRVSQGTHSTEPQESSDSRSRYTTSSGSMMTRSGGAPSLLEAGSGIPMPPRHPRARARAGTVPLPSGQSSSAESVAFPRAVERERTRAQSNLTQAFGVAMPSRRQPSPGEELAHESDHEQAAQEPEAEDEEGEEEDEVGLLSNASSRGPSPRTSLRHRTSSSSFAALRHRASNSFSQSMSQLQNPVRAHRQSHGSGSGSRSSSKSRTNSHSGSGSSISIAVRSRAQSLMQNVVEASHSSLENINIAIPGRRSRANSSMARLEEDVPAETSFSSNSDGRTQTHSRSGSTAGTGTGSASAENYTFGQPLPSSQVRNAQPAQESMPVQQPHSPVVPSATPSQVFSSRTATPPGPDPSETSASPPNPSFISTAPPSFVTPAPTMEGTTTDDSIGRRTGETWIAEHKDFDRNMHERTSGTWRPT